MNSGIPWDGLWKGKRVYTQWMMEWMWQNSDSCFNFSVGLKLFKRTWQASFLKPLRYWAACGRLAGHTALVPAYFYSPHSKQRGERQEGSSCHPQAPSLHHTTVMPAWRFSDVVCLNVWLVNHLWACIMRACPSSARTLEAERKAKP